MPIPSSSSSLSSGSAHKVEVVVGVVVLDLHRFITRDRSFVTTFVVVVGGGGENIRNCGGDLFRRG